MNIRQQKYKQFRLQGFTKFASAIKAGYSRNTAWNATRNIEKRCDFDKLLEIEGLSDNEIAKIAKDGVQATKLQSINSQVIERPDWKARHSFMETVLKLKGKLQDKGSDVRVAVQVNNKVGSNGTFDGEDRELANRLLGAVRAKLQK